MTFRVLDLPFAKDVHTLGPDQLVGEAVTLCQKHHIGSVVVVDSERRVLGIFTDRDYINKIAGGQPGMDSDSISKHMTPNPKSVKLNDPVMKAALSMRLGRFRHVVIVDDNNVLGGLISVKDVLDWMMDSISS
jgi:CBS domain-containing protein